MYDKRMSPEFIGWPNEGIEYWNAHWRGQAAQGFFDGMDAAYDYDCAGCGHPNDDICTVWLTGPREGQRIPLDAHGPWTRARLADGV